MKFTAYNPTVLHFGKDIVSRLNNSLKKYGKNVLLVYGKGSIKSNGIYDTIKDLIQSNNCNYFEFSGIKANPVVTDARKLLQYINENNIELIIAAGGGSVIDTSKIVSVCAKENIDPWDFMKSKVSPKLHIPVIAILTLAATGTEMNPFGVLQNHDTNEKIGYGNPLMYPVESYLDPSYTLSVPKDQTSNGISDLIAHCFEAYFGEGDATLTDKFIFSIVNEAIEYGTMLMDDLNNITLREKIMWAATCALNGMTLHGKKSGDWGVHDLGHTISYLFDTAHGATLSIAYPAWLNYVKAHDPDRVNELGKNLFGTETANDFINELITFYKRIDAPVSLNEVNIGFDQYDKLLGLMEKNQVGGANYKLDSTSYKAILNFMYQEK